MKLIITLSLFFTLNCYADVVKLTSGEFPPFVGSELKNGGLASEVVTRIFSEMGEQAVISFRPWKRGFSETMTGKYLGTFPYSKNTEREKTLLFSHPIYELEEHFFTMKDAKVKYESEQDLTNLRICKPLGYNLFGLKKLAQEKTIYLESPKSMGHCFKMLASGRVDMVMTNETTGWTYIEDLFGNRKQFTMTEKSFVKIGHYFIVPKSNQQGPGIIKAFNEILDKLKLNGEIELIKNKHIR